MDLKQLFGLDGKVVVITGAASGMARSAAELLIELGAKVHAIDINPIDLPVTETYQADLSCKDVIDKLVDELPNNIYAFYSCHGISHFPGREMLVSKVNFYGQKYMTELLLPKITDHGSVTYISSVGGFGWQQNYQDVLDLIAQPTWDAAMAWYEDHKELIIDDQTSGSKDYTFAKKCLNSYVNAMCMNPLFINRKIRLNSICPGDTTTGLTNDFNKSTGKGDVEAGAAKIAAVFLKSWNGYAAAPKDMGYPLVILGSDICSYISGQIIYIDYGLTSSWAHKSLIK